MHAVVIFEPIKFLRINVAALGQNTLLAVLAGKKFRIINYNINAQGGANTVDFNSSGGAILAGGYDLAADADKSFVGNIESPAFETAVGEGLRLNLSAATAVTGHLAYIEMS